MAGFPITSLTFVSRIFEPENVKMHVCVKLHQETPSDFESASYDKIGSKTTFLEEFLSETASEIECPYDV